MAGKTARDAFDAFAQAYQRALLCVASARFGTEGHRDPGALHSASVGATPVALRADPPLGLQVDVQYRIVPTADPAGPWAVRLEQYVYALRTEHDVELFAYHWHPQARSWVTWPHLHLGSV